MKVKRTEGGGNGASAPAQLRVGFLNSERVSAADGFIQFLPNPAERRLNALSDCARWQVVAAIEHAHAGRSLRHLQCGEGAGTPRQLRVVGYLLCPKVR